jgi:CBS domain-containing protein
MRVSEAMTRSVQIASPNQSIHDVAKIMADCDVGCLPVGENNRLIGMITDRDIAVRAVAKGRLPDSTRVCEIMSPDVKYCFEDAELSEVALNMADIKVHRLPVVDHQKQLVGILALGDLAACEGPQHAGTAVCGISTPGAPSTMAFPPSSSAQ